MSAFGGKADITLTYRYIRLWHSADNRGGATICPILVQKQTKTHFGSRPFVR
jgi:hypothetical protein